MSPIPRHAVKLIQRIRDADLRNRTLTLIETATAKPDLAHFTIATLKNPSHTSHTDLKAHATALLATAEQYKNKKVQPIHIYHDNEGRYTGHVLYAERDMKPSDE